MQCLIDGAAVHVETAGAGEAALVLVHGACHDHRAWTPVLDALGDSGIALYAPDLPAHGASAGPALPDIAAQAQWLLRLLDACGLTRCALAGHSMGSLIALHAAALAPQRVSHLALVGSAVDQALHVGSSRIFHERACTAGVRAAARLASPGHVGYIDGNMPDRASFST